MLSSDDLEVHGVCVIGRSCSDEQSKKKGNHRVLFFRFARRDES
jgi:hypothetical protein